MGGGIEELLSTLRNSLSNKDRRLGTKTRKSRTDLHKLRAGCASDLALEDENG
jgi:hypothetical protein